LSIPALNEDGFLPDGIFECTIDEISERFGSFQRTDKRPNLFKGLLSYYNELKSANIGKHLIVNGSFVTTKDEPNDIDVLLILKDDVELSGDLPPFKKNTMSRKYINKYYQLDFHFGFEGDPSATNILEIFLEVKYQPEKTKGILKIAL